MLLLDEEVGMILAQVLGEAIKAVDPIATGVNEIDNALCLRSLLFGGFHLASLKLST